MQGKIRKYTVYTNEGEILGYVYAEDGDHAFGVAVLTYKNTGYVELFNS